MSQMFLMLAGLLGAAGAGLSGSGGSSKSEENEPVLDNFTSSEGDDTPVSIGRDAPVFVQAPAEEQPAQDQNPPNEPPSDPVQSPPENSGGDERDDADDDREDAPEQPPEQDTAEPVPPPPPAPDTPDTPQEPSPPEPVELVASDTDQADDGPVLEVAGLNSIDVLGGRVTTLKFAEPEDLLSVSVIDKPDVGNLTVNPDGTLALVLSHPTAKAFSGTLDFSYEVNYQDGSSQTVTQTANVSTSRQVDGWGEGDHYMLETDEDGELVIEHGDNHRELYVTGNDLALSIEEIAELEEMDVRQVTGDWLAESIYGRSPDTALDAQAGRMAWDALTGLDAEPGSHWMMFEKGYDYDVGRLIDEGSAGESELHPLYIGSYGEGSLPVLSGDLRIFQKASANIVFRDIALGNKVQTLEGGNFIYDGIDNNGEEIAFQARGAHTLRDSIVADSHDDEPTSDIWDPNGDRVQGVFTNYAQGLLFENNLFDLNGWEEGYSYDASADAPQAPSMFNHNLYISREAGDITLRDNIILRGASFGAQVRPGGFIEDNVFAGNNIGVNFLGGNSTGDGARTGNFTLFTDNVITSGGFHVVAIKEGATTWAIDAAGAQSTLSGNIVTHLVEPNTTPDFNPNYNDTKTTLAIVSTAGDRIYYDDTIVYNWALPNGDNNAPDTNVDGLDQAALDQITIENFTASVLGQSDGSVEDLAVFLRDQVQNGAIDPVDADEIISYFQTGFGLPAEDDVRTESETLRFIPDALGDGIRWDNRMNWSTDDLPETVEGDSVDLAGNWVVYGGTTTVADLDFGSGGQLAVTHGYLQIDGDLQVGTDGGYLDIDNAGQVWTNGYSDSDLLEVDVNGGRFANTGQLDGRIDLEIGDNAQALLATAGAALDLNAGSRVTVNGSDADVGFDGETGGAAGLSVETGASLSFVADAEGFSDISEFRSGHYEQDAPDVASQITLNGGALIIDLTALNGKELQETLLSADTLEGAFETVELLGLADDQDATVMFDYDMDQISIDVSARGAGTGQSEAHFLGGGSSDVLAEVDISDLFIDVDVEALLAQAEAAEGEDPELQPELV